MVFVCHFLHTRPLHSYLFLLNEKNAEMETPRSGGPLLVNKYKLLMLTMWEAHQDVQLDLLK